MAAAPTQLKLFGACGLFRADGEPIKLPTRHCLHVLAVLCEAEGFTVDRLALAAAVWPDAELTDGRNNLRTALAALRKVLPVGAICAEGLGLQLCPGAVREIQPATADERARFMPGFDTEWAIDRRLRHRQQVTSELLDEALNADAPQVRLAKLDEAHRIDPLSQEVAEARVQELKRQGKLSEAVGVGDAFRVRMVRELGVLPETEPSPADEAPIVKTAEWLLSRDPAQALGLLTSTESYWHGVSVQRSLELYDRALGACRPTEPGYHRARAQRFYLLASIGHLYPVRLEAERLFDEAAERGELPTAVRLSMALSYAYLSNGSFQQSLAFSRRGASLGERLADQELRRETGIHLSIIEQHTGQVRQSRRTLEKWAAAIEENGSPRERAHLLIARSQVACNAGRLEQAFECLTVARRLYASMGAMRNLFWVDYETANLLAQTGDNGQARQILHRLQALDSNDVGHSLQGMVADTLAWVESRLGQMDSAVESMARGYAQRQKLGTVPSLYEQRFLRSAQASVTRRLGESQVRRIFQQALQSGRLLVS